MLGGYVVFSVFLFFFDFVSSPPAPAFHIDSHVVVTFLQPFPFSRRTVMSAFQGQSQLIHCIFVYKHFTSVFRSWSLFKGPAISHNT